MDKVEHYDSQYAHFASETYRAIRAQTFDEDFGQNGWITAAEQDRFLEWLALPAGARLLDVACGSGGPALRLCRLGGFTIEGIDIHEQGIANAAADAARQGLGDRATFRRVDAGTALPYAPASFDAITCIDAINHLPGRAAVLAEWMRVLEPGGRLLFTDPIVVTGPLTNEEIAVRSSIGFFLFVPDGEDDRLLEAAGFEVRRKEDRTENLASVAGRWHAAREQRAEDVRRAEGEKTFVGQQRFLEVCTRLAAERRLSRHAYLAVKPD